MKKSFITLGHDQTNLNFLCTYTPTCNLRCIHAHIVCTLNRFYSDRCYAKRSVCNCRRYCQAEMQNHRLSTAYIYMVQRQYNNHSWGKQKYQNHKVGIKVRQHQNALIKTKNINTLPDLKLSNVVFIMVINVKTATFFDILTFITCSRLNFIHEFLYIVRGLFFY